MDSPYTKELIAAIAAVRLAAQISLTVLSQSQTTASSSLTNPDSSSTLIKDDLSPVTIADFAIQALLTTHLSQHFPSHSFIGEESADGLRANPHLLQRVLQILTLSDPSTPWTADSICTKIDSCTALTCPSPDFTWIFDPIDGTKTYMQQKQYAINVALLRNSQQLLSVVALPLLSPDVSSSPISDSTVDPTKTGTLLYAVRSHGTFLLPLFPSNDSPGGIPPKKLASISPGTTTPLSSVTCTTVDSGISPLHSLISSRLQIPYPGTNLLGWVPRWSSLALGLGNTTVWIYNSRSRSAKIWDHAGAMLLFEEVGGKITDVRGKDIDLSAGRKLSKNFGFVAAPRGEQHASVLKMVQDTLREEGRDDLLV
ncbi:hypothetical protein QBC44DRAFT_328495 [Cladorrhinum sp. PSN332]|nr:hypothetical protein QBC44DRAFT_328495 [Cladorrhinum sp. PSN332]